MKNRLTQQGLTLLEILVAMLIFSIILGVVYSTFFGSSKPLLFWNPTRTSIRRPVHSWA